MDVDEVLKFLALDIALVNNDGYWRDGSDFNVYRNRDGRFMLTPHDANEGFRTGIFYAIRCAEGEGRQYFRVEEIAIEGVIRPKWRDIVIEDAPGGGQRVNRINYEICVLQTLARAAALQGGVGGGRRPVPQPR